ncbi:MAG: bifunctional folylpolyglutamate synthase/dihydrofolate synthase [Phycisphaeraceae bacterium]|nr:MAG: bifunctional folylpolyglutamate synthase/dihydrofolate synthase [Phycisphaeraceae bacterium]
MTQREPQRGKPASGIEAKGRRRRAFSSFAAAEKWLDERVNFERTRHQRIDPAVFKLDRMRALMAALGDPQSTMPIVHIAGSKGKGSVCEMLSSCLGANGYACGVYTSPHLVSVQERIRLGHEPVGEAAFARLLGLVRDAAEGLPAKLGAATYFECVTALGFLYFAEQAVDAAVVEVGLGGRLDSTNIITPVVCGIAEIQREHTAILGDTLELIAAEKAGIMKSGVPCLTVPQTDGVIGVFEKAAETVGASLLVLGREVEYTKRFESAHAMGPHTRICVTTGDLVFEHLPVPFEGEHQAENCGLALAILHQLTKLGFECSERGVAKGLASARRNGRLERVWDKPRIIIDGAHTGESIRRLINAIGAHVRCDSMVVIFGCAADKDVDTMLEEIGRGADKVIFTKASGNPRAQDPHELQRRFEEVHGKMSQVEPTLKDAINTAARAVQRDDLICVTGSFVLAGEAKGLLEAKRRGLAAAGV